MSERGPMQHSVVRDGAVPASADAALLDAIATAIRDGIGVQITEMRRFVDRRFAEISAEIHAGATMAEMTEATLAEQISHVQQEVARMVAAPMIETRTSGLELEAVVQGTEVAANQILEAAEAITDWIQRGADARGATAMAGQLQSRFEACRFQDLTSQRIRRAIRHLEQVDNMLGSIVAAEPVSAAPLVPAGPGGTGADLDQNTIDRLMGG
jgi:chemotaxis protein CheZ